MGVSIESSRPIMAPSLASKRASTRFSTYSATPTMATTHTTTSTSSAQNEINEITANLDKLENKKLTSQRFVPSESKSDLLSKLALGAKLERALSRRMGGQDAEMRVKKKEVVEQSAETAPQAVPEKVEIGVAA